MRPRLASQCQGRSHPVPALCRMRIRPGSTIAHLLSISHLQSGRLCRLPMTPTALLYQKQSMVPQRTLALYSASFWERVAAVASSSKGSYLTAHEPSPANGAIIRFLGPSPMNTRVLRVGVAEQAAWKRGFLVRG